MTPEQLVPLFGEIYLWLICGGLALLLLAEALIPLVPFGSDRDRTFHVLRNTSLWILSLVLADYAFGDWVLDIPSRLFVTSSGLLHGLSLPVAAWLVIGVVAIDFGEYLFHRLAHYQRPLWLLHAVHHADDRVDVTTGLRFHPVEVAINLAWRVCFLSVLGLPFWPVAARALFMAPTSFLQHANIRIPSRLDRAVRWVFVTPGMHRVHHSPLAEQNNTNFGELFSIWDRLFGTFYEPDDSAVIDCGLPNLRGERWQTLWGMLATPANAFRIRWL